jgi:Holliday junction DNA helicase RuvB
VNEVIKFSTENREVVSGACLPEDKEPDILSLRPACFTDYVGQKEIVETLKIAVEAAKMRKEPVDHVLFHGPPGLGKTTLAHIIANETGGTLTVTSGPALEKGVHARSHRFRLKRFTLIGATTRIGLISSPLRDRFGILRSLDFYTEAELIRIIKRSAALLDVPLDDFGAAELAARSRGTPRIVNRLLRRVRDYAQVRSDGTIKRNTVEAALALEGVDEKGLTDLDRRFIRTVIEFYNGGPVGIEAIAATLQEETDTLVDVVEPYLLKAGLITRTSAGRKATEAAYRHLGFKIQKKLF